MGSAQNENRSFFYAWRENHGNFLLGVLTIILMVGATLLLLPKKGSTDLPGIRGVDYEAADDPVDPNSQQSDGALESEVLGTTVDGTGSPSPEDMALLVVKIEGLKNNRGHVRMALYSDSKSFNQSELADAKQEIEINENQATWEVWVPAGKPVAISAYHDQNDNQKLDKSIIGIPVESYGFSNGTRSPTGPPKFEDASFVPEVGAFEVPIQIW